MIKIKKSSDADSRTSMGEVTKEILLENTKSHISDVRQGCSFIANKIIADSMLHDYTKEQYIDEFFKDFSSGKTGADFKKLGWWKKHTEERHHLNDKVPEDVNLVDVIEMIVDGCMAGMARSGSVYDIEIPNEVLQSAVKNTQKMIIENTEVVD